MNKKEKKIEKEVNTTLELGGLITKLKSLFNAVDHKEKEIDIDSLDEKMLNRLNKGGYSDLADSLSQELRQAQRIKNTLTQEGDLKDESFMDVLFPWILRGAYTGFIIASTAIITLTVNNYVEDALLATESKINTDINSGNNVTDLFTDKDLGKDPTAEDDNAEIDNEEDIDDTEGADETLIAEGLNDEPGYSLSTVNTEDSDKKTYVVMAVSEDGTYECDNSLSDSCLYYSEYLVNQLDLFNSLNLDSELFKLPDLDQEIGIYKVIVVFKPV